MPISDCYAGSPIRTAQGGFLVNKNGQPLSPKASQKLFNHSPNGFNWGYGGSGPAQLALALLLDATGDKDVALGWYQQYKREVVATWSHHWQTTKAEIHNWLQEKLKEATDAG